MDLGEMVVRAGNYAFGRGVSATPNAATTGVEQQKQRLLKKRIQRVLMIAMGLLTLAIMARTMKHSPDAPGGHSLAVVAAAPPAAGSRTDHLDYAPG